MGVAGLFAHLDHALQPIDGVLVPVLPDNVAVRRDLNGTFLSKTLLDVGPSQIDDDDVLVQRRVGLEPVDRRADVSAREASYVTSCILPGSGTGFQREERVQWKAQAVALEQRKAREGLCRNGR